MSALVVSAFVSVDGVVQAPGGPDEDRDGGFEHGGWSFPYFDEQLGEIMTWQFARTEALLLGRRTYELFASYWPHVTDEDGPVAAKLNSAPKYVASRTLDALDWNNSHLLPGDAAESVADLKPRIDGEINVQGSSHLVKTLQRSDLVDEYRLVVEPVVLGRGKRLFGEESAPAAFDLVEARSLPTGVVFCRYQWAGRPRYGSFALDAEQLAG